MTKALVVLSGGQDSTTCLFWAKSIFSEVHALTFDYGQRHSIEIEAAKRVAALAEVASHEILELGGGILQGRSPLVNPDVDVQHYANPAEMPDGVEPTFVPGRNILFLTIAANRAFVKRCAAVVLGVSQEDFGGYPDCRDKFIYLMRQALNEGLYGKNSGLAIYTPLIFKTKKETVLLADSFEGCCEALAYTHTCYDGEYPPNPANHASMIRARGFKEAGCDDPLIVRAKSEGLLPADYPGHGYIEAKVIIAVDELAVDADDVKEIKSRRVTKRKKRKKKNDEGQ